jgi:hypothetical protein
MENTKAIKKIINAKAISAGCSSPFEISKKSILPE